MKFEVILRHCRQSHLFLAIAVILFITVVGVSSFERQYFNYGTETDFLGGFMREAQRFLDSEPLQLEFHPPAYPITIGLLNSVVGDWDITGRVISLVAATVVLVCAYFVFLDLGGRFMAWGAALGLAASGVFLHYASVSSSDMFYAALFWISALLSLKAIEAKSPRAWFASGLLIGLTLLSRTNAVVAILFLFGAWLPGSAIAQKKRFTIAALGGLCVPLSLWALYALATGSALMPKGTATLLALMYLDGDQRLVWDGIMGIEGRFSSSLDVLLHDPVRVIKVYTEDLALLMFRLPLTLAHPWQLFFAPGLLLLLMRPWSKNAVLLLTVLCAGVLVNNFKAYEGRFYLFLLPLFGAGAGEMYHRILSAATLRWMRTSLACVLAMAYCGAVALAARESHQVTYQVEKELSEAVPAVRRVIEADAEIVARKSVVAHYVNAEAVYLPAMAGLQELRRFLLRYDGQPLYLYFGSAEVSLRPSLAMLAKVENAPPWLSPVARSANPGAWVLYRYVPEQGKTP